jgi:hypothetical protein
MEILNRITWIIHQQLKFDGKFYLKLRERNEIDYNSSKFLLAPPQIYNTLKELKYFCPSPHWYTKLKI